jgi:PadR family transcriptional regulator, regulatory protein AphA
VPSFQGNAHGHEVRQDRHDAASVVRTRDVRDLAMKEAVQSIVAAAEQVAGGAVECHATLPEKDEPMSQADDFTVLVRNKHGGQPQFLVQPQEFVLKFSPHAMVEGRERLVQQEKLRLPNERSGQGHPLPLAPGQALGVAMLEFLQLDHLEKQVNPGVFAAACGEFEVSPDRHGGEQGIALEDEPHAPLLRGDRDSLLAIHPGLTFYFDPPVVRFFQAGQDAQQCGLAGTGDAVQDKELASRDPKIDLQVKGSVRAYQGLANFQSNHDVPFSAKCRQCSHRFSLLVGARQISRARCSIPDEPASQGTSIVRPPRRKVKAVGPLLKGRKGNRLLLRQRRGIGSHIMTAQPLNKPGAAGPRNPAEYPVLGILTRGPAHGYDICRLLREGIGSIWRLGKSQVYALLIRLEREGLVGHERIGQETLPAKNIFSLNPRGAEVFEEWLDSPVYHVRDIRLEFLTKLWFAHQRGLEAEKRLVERQLAACREKVERLQALSAFSRTQTESRSISFRLAVLGAAVSWLEALSGTMEGVSRP